MAAQVTPDQLAARIGTEFGLSKWFEVDQDRIKAFADTTEDWQAIHLDPEAARAAGFTGAVAHGFLTLSMLSALAYDALPDIEGQKTSINYGFDRIRFISPVPAGALIRARFVLEEVEDRGPHTRVLSFAVTVEIDEQDKPALSAIWRIMYQF